MTTNLDELERMLEGAPNLPWQSVNQAVICTTPFDDKFVCGLCEQEVADFIAAAVNALPDLIKRVRDAEKDAAKYKWLMTDGPLTFKEVMQFMGNVPAHAIDWRVQMDMHAEQAYAASITSKEQTK